eukprot:4978453-Ditylum_brightwellii.AAC.1
MQLFYNSQLGYFKKQDAKEKNSQAQCCHQIAPKPPPPPSPPSPQHDTNNEKKEEGSHVQPTTKQ